MICSRAAWVDDFLAGRLGDEWLTPMESHVENCEECFLRMAAGAGEMPLHDRSTLRRRSSLNSRVSLCLDSSWGPSSGGAMSPAPETLPAAIGRYAVNGLLGVGGMSIVYRAVDPETGAEVAVKTVAVPSTAAWVAQLRQEIACLRETRHPAIVSVLDADSESERPWYAMELFSGPTLEGFNRILWMEALSAPPLAAGGRLPEVLRLFARLCQPVSFIHASGMVHGDIKPSNIMLRPDQQPILMDFGLASRARGMVGREVLDVTGRIRGTLPYIAPETIRGQLPDARADLYAIGCMLYESTVGAPPFVSGRGSKIIDMHLTAGFTPASERVAGVPPELDELFVQLLAKDPRGRLGHASALSQSLAALAERLSSLRPAAPPPPAPAEGVMPLFRPPVVGREREMSVIVDALAATRARPHGRMFLLAGESGIGKTFLTAEVAQRALLQGIHVTTSECAPSALRGGEAADRGSTPLQAFQPFFESLRDRCHERGRSEVDRVFGDRLELLADYLPSLRSLRPAGEPRQAPPRLPSSAARERIVSAVLDTVAAYAAGRITLLAIDDLQWADDLSIAVLERMHDDLFTRSPVLVVATFRSEESTDQIRRLAGKPSTQTLPLGRLDHDGTSSLVGGMLAMPEPPSALVDYVHVNAEGIPFFAAEYLRSLVAEGALAYRAGAWSLRSGKDITGQLGVPRTLQDLIRGRLQRLSPSALDLLAAAAVAGRRGTTALVSRMLELGGSALREALDEAAAAQMIENDDEGSYAFVHDKIRETLYADLAPERRAQLHLCAARAMEALDAAPSDRSADIGRHYLKGGEILRGIDYLEKAGERALGMAANADAEQFFREVTELEVTLPARQPALRRARWLRQRGDALQGLGMMTESADSLRLAAALLGRPLPTTKAAFAAQLGREVVRQAWSRVRASGGRPRGNGRNEVHAEVARVFERMHEVSYYLGRDADLVLSTTVALNACERATQTSSLAVAYCNAAMMAGVLPIHALAERYFHLASVAIAGTPDPTAESWLLEMEGHYRHCQGDRDRAVSALERAIALARKGGFFRRSDEAESLGLCFDLLAGQHRRVLAQSVEIERSARRRRDFQVQVWAMLERAEAHVIGGDLDRASAEIQRATEVVPSLDRPDKLWALSLQAYIAYKRGDRHAARSLVREAVAVAAKGPLMHSYCVGPCGRLAEAAIGLCAGAGSPAERRADAKAARKIVAVLKRARPTFRVARPVESLNRGALDLVLGRRSSERVIDEWTAAAAEAGRLSMPYYELRLIRAILQASDGRPPPPGALPDNLTERAAHLERVLDLGTNRA